MQPPPRDNISALSQVPLFARLSREELQALGLRVRMRSFKAGDIIFHRNDPGATFFVILRGVVKIFLSSEEGQEVVLIILKEGEFMGELSLIDGEPRSASAQALEATDTLTIDRDSLLDFIGEHPRAGLNIFAVMASRFRRADGVIADCAFLDLQTRLNKMLVELVKQFGRRRGSATEIDLRLSQRDLASMVASTRESVNRLLVGLEGEGIVRLDRQRITVLRLDLLEERVHQLSM